MRKLFEGAEREVRQLRLACIHPQMTAYWQNLSAELQLDSVSHCLFFSAGDAFDLCCRQDMQT